MSNDTTDTFEGSGPELHSMTREFDELHHDVGMPAMREAVAEMRVTSRRTFLMGAGSAVAGRPAWPRRRPGSWAPFRRWWRCSPRR